MSNAEKTQLEKVSQANARNLLNKLKEGKPLTDKQLAFLTNQLKGKDDEKKAPLLERELNTKEIETLCTIGIRQIQNLRTSGDIAGKGDGSYDLSHVRDYIKYLRRLTDNRRPEPKETDLDRNQQAARKDAAHAEKLEMENSVRKDELLDAEGAIERWGQVCSNVRASLMSMPSRMAKELSSMEEPREIQIMLDREVRDILTSLSG